MTNLALKTIELPDSVGADVHSALVAGPDIAGGPSKSRDEWLLLYGAALCSRPDLLDPRAVIHLERLVRDPTHTANTRRMAGDVLKFALSSPVGPQAAESVMRLLGQPGNDAAICEMAVDCLRWATRWAIQLLDADTLLGILELEHVAPYRIALLAQVIEPCLYAEDAIPPDRLVRFLQLCGNSEETKYPAYNLLGKDGLPDYLANRFPCHEPVAEHLGKGCRRALVIHNIHDGQGDEILRTMPLLQALLDFNVELEVVLITRRVYLYAHQRLHKVSIDQRDRVSSALEEPYEVLIDFFEPNVKQVNYAPYLETAVDEFRRRFRPVLDIRSAKGYNLGLYERVDLRLPSAVRTIRLDKSRLENIYEPTMRLIAELGLPLRRGEGEPRSEPVLAGTAWPDADRFWQQVTSANPGRPVALFWPFGGAEELKGHVSKAAVAGEARRLVHEGYFVVVVPSGSSWGTTQLTERAISLLPPEQQALVAIGPARDGSPCNIPSASADGTSMSLADRVMSLVIRGIQFADLVVTVEGWMMHAAYLLGKPYRVLMLPYSQDIEWHPYGRTGRQGVSPAVPALASDGVDEPPLLERPRKSVFIFLLRKLGNAGTEDALPLLLRAAQSKDRDIRQAAAAALGALRGAKADACLARMLDDTSHGVRAAAARALLEKGPKPETVPREHLLTHVWIDDKARNWERILRFGQLARPAIDLAARDDDPVVRREAAQALRVLDFQRSVAHDPTAVKQWKHTSNIASILWEHVLEMSWFRLPGLGWFRRSKQDKQPKVLILTPVKDAAVFIPGYYKRITCLTYPGELVSLGFLESDSRDATFYELKDRLPRLRKRFRRVGLWKKDFSFQVPPGFNRWTGDIQAERRAALAKSRNHLLFHALDDEDWVLWLDVDVIEYPEDILERLLAVGKDILQPHCVVDYGGPTFDRNAWRDQARLNMDKMRDEGDLVELHAVGGTMLLVRADLHREGLIFPPWPYGKASSLSRDRGEIETEGLGIMAWDMGYRCWGMPNLEVRHGRW